MRLIDADALEARIMMDAPGFLDGGSEITKAFIMAMIKTKSVTPTVDAVPVVRCKDCKYWHKTIYDTPKWMPCMSVQTSGNWFCADGVKRE
jgi:hypothetical protein